METRQLQAIIEGALLASGEPLSLKKLASLFDEHETPEKEQLEQALENIAGECEQRGFELKQVASGWRLQVREELAPWVNRLWEEKPQKYSRALLETLALIAYRQPITRGDIEEIRGVAVSSHIIKTLGEREWIKVVGQRDVPGRPSLYATTRQFLDYFNLNSLEQLPTLSEIRDLDEINNALDFGASAGAGEGDSPSAEGENPDRSHDGSDEPRQGEGSEPGAADPNPEATGADESATDAPQPPDGHEEAPEQGAPDPGSEDSPAADDASPGELAHSRDETPLDPSVEQDTEYKSV